MTRGHSQAASPSQHPLHRQEVSDQQLVELIDACTNGVESAFVQLYTATSAQLFGVLRRLLGTEALAEEALKDTYIKIWNNAGRYPRDSMYPRTWLLSIARNHAIDLLRQRLSRKREEVELNGDHAAMDVTMDRKPSLHQRHESSQLLDTCLEQIAQPARECVLSAYCDGFSLEELSEQLQKPVGTIRSWIRRSLISIRECVDELYRDGDAVRDGDAADDRDAVHYRGAAHDAVPSPVRRRPEWRRAGRRSITGSRTFWKSVAGLATAAAIALSAVLLRAVDQPPDSIQVQVPESVSIVQNEQREALWLLTTRARSRTLQVLALAPPPVDADQSYVLWMVKPDNAGVEAVGLLPLTEGETSLLTLPVDTAVAELFAVSLEPRGGSPEAGPAGPLLFSGKIIETTGRQAPR